MKVSIDKVVLKIPDVFMWSYEEMFRDLQNDNRLIVNPYIGIKESQYHYNLNIKWYENGLKESESSVFFGYKHNMCKTSSMDNASYDLKVEFNPNKTISILLAYLSRFVSKRRRKMIDLDKKVIKNNTEPCVTSFDIAIDLPLPVFALLVTSNTGRTPNVYQGNKYFGLRSKNGYLKVYDKKKERKEKANQDIEETTRIEYTWKATKEKDYLEFSRFPYYILEEADDKYIISRYNEQIDQDATLRAVLYAIQQEVVQLSEFKDYTRRKIKTHLKSQKPLKFVHFAEGFYKSWRKISLLFTKDLISINVINKKEKELIEC